MGERSAQCPQCGQPIPADAPGGACPNCTALASPSAQQISYASLESLLKRTLRRTVAADSLLGKTLGEFVVLERIGRGGMGAVYKARQPSLDRFVAIKVLLPELAANAEFVQRFDREARTAAHLSHPQIVQVHAVGEAEGIRYIAMEYVDGEGLDAALRREGRLAPERAFQALKEVCAALAAAHDAGIVHRDIKPSNLLVDSDGSVRVSDFGLARRPEGDVSVTLPGEVLGTPLYMAPEVAMGAPAGPLSDLYSLGATFYHLLAGRPPLEGRTASEVIIKQVTEAPFPLDDVAPHVDPRLARLIDRLLLKKPSERPGSARALLEELEALGPLRRPEAPAHVPIGGGAAEAPTVHLSALQRPERQAAPQRGATVGLPDREQEANTAGQASRGTHPSKAARRPKKLRRRLLLASSLAAVVLAVALIAAFGRRGPTPRQAVSGRSQAGTLETEAKPADAPGVGARHASPLQASLPPRLDTPGLPAKASPRPGPPPEDTGLRPPAPAPADEFGPMAAKPTVPLDASFGGETMEPWVSDGDEWEPEGTETIVCDTHGNGWFGPRGRFADFVAEADVTDLGGRQGATYGLVFRRVGEWQLLFALDPERKNARLQSVSQYDPQPGGVVPRVSIREVGKAVATPGQKRHLKVECVGPRVRCYVGDELVAEAMDLALLSGDLRLYVHHARVRFSNVRVRPAAEAPPGGLGRLWWGRAELVAASCPNPRAKAQAWADILERFPQAPPASLALAAQERGRWTQEAARTVGVATERSKRYERTTLEGRVWELADGRFHIAYTAERDRHLWDWERALGQIHLSVDQAFCMCNSGSPPNAMAWAFSHGEDVRVRFLAQSSTIHGCSLFAEAGDPLNTGIVLAVGADQNRATTLGPPGQEAWFRDRAAADYTRREHDLEVARGELVYRLGGAEVFRRRIDVAALRGRRAVLWADPRGRKPGEPPSFSGIHIVTAPQSDWVRSEPAGAPPPRDCLRPDPQGWLGLAHADEGVWGFIRREGWAMRWGRTLLANVSPQHGWNRYIPAQGRVRDFVVAARVEFAGPPKPHDGGAVSLTLRGGEETYLASVFPFGGIALRRRVGHSRDPAETLAEAPGFPAPGGIVYLAALVLGRRVELFCNGRPALAWDGLSETEGTVGIEIEASAAIIHDFRWRPLPSDPMYAKVYGAKAP